MNGTTISLVSISKTKLCFLPKHLPLFYKRSIRTPLWNWGGRYSDLQPCFKSWKLVVLWRDMRRGSLSTLSLVCLRTLKCIGLTILIRLRLKSCMPKWSTKFWGFFLLLTMWLWHVMRWTLLILGVGFPYTLMWYKIGWNFHRSSFFKELLMEQELTTSLLSWWRPYRRVEA